MKPWPPLQQAARHTGKALLHPWHNSPCTFVLPWILRCYPWSAPAHQLRWIRHRPSNRGRRCTTHSPWPLPGCSTNAAAIWCKETHTGEPAGILLRFQRSGYSWCLRLSGYLPCDEENNTAPLHPGSSDPGAEVLRTIPFCRGGTQCGGGRLADRLDPLAETGESRTIPETRTASVSAACRA